LPRPANKKRCTGGKVNAAKGKKAQLFAWLMSAIF
jgi:hypothetical protein